MNVYPFLFRSKFFLFILLVLESVDLDDMTILVFRCLSITLILIDGSYFMYTANLLVCHTLKLLL